MSKKTHDLIVKMGEYQSGGETKARWRNVGSVIQTDKGAAVLLNRDFNPAGVPGNEDRDSILISVMKADRDNAPPQATPDDGIGDSEIPF